jgi:hypothetical protein
MPERGAQDSCFNEKTRAPIKHCTFLSVREQKFRKDWNSAEQVGKDKEPLRKSGLWVLNCTLNGLDRDDSSPFELPAVTRLKLESHRSVHISMA